MSKGQKRKKKGKRSGANPPVTPALQPGSQAELEHRRQARELKAENRILRAQLGKLDPDTWPPRYRSLIHRLTRGLLELEEAATPIKGRILQPAGRTGGGTSSYDEGASTRNARRMQDRIVREVNAVLDGSWNPSIEGKRCRRSPNQCPMSGRVQRPAWTGHVLRFCAGCGHAFPFGDATESAISG